MTPDERRDRVRAAALAGLRAHDERAHMLGGVTQAVQRERAADDITARVLAALGDPVTDDEPMRTARVDPPPGGWFAPAPDEWPHAGITAAEAMQGATDAVDRLLAVARSTETCNVCAGRGDGCYPDPEHDGWWYCGWSGAGRPDVAGLVHARWPAECPAGPVPDHKPMPVHEGRTDPRRTTCRTCGGAVVFARNTWHHAH